MSVAANSTIFVKKLASEPPRLKKRKPFSLPRPKNNSHQQIGFAAESQACLFLEKKGYLILGRNVRFPCGEIDIVCQTHSTLVFVEVKARKNDWFGHPSQAVSQKKQLRLQRAVSEYLSHHPSTLPYRYDIISILPGKIEHFENVTLE